MVVLNHSLWVRRFGADPNIVGKTLTLNAKTFTVIGVTPPDFHFPFSSVELWSPIVFDAQEKSERRKHYLQVLGMLKPGVGVAQAHADIDAISQRAKSLFPETNARTEHLVINMNKDFSRAARPDKPLEIVGVVGDVKNKLDEIAEPYIYIAHAQITFSGMGIVVRTAAEPTAITPAVRGEVMALDPALPISGLKTMEQIVFERTTPKRIITAMMGVFAVFALLMAGAGIYAVMAYAVSRRTHEIGVRLALGASPSDILRMITRQGMKLTLAGLAFGLAGAFALTRVMSGILYGVSPADPLTFALVSLLFIGAALLACWIPARRAMQVDPMVALRCE